MSEIVESIPPRLQEIIEDFSWCEGREKLELLLKLREAEHITWSGKHRASLEGQGVYPRPFQDLLPIWVAVGGTPESSID